MICIVLTLLVVIILSYCIDIFLPRESRVRRLVKWSISAISIILVFVAWLSYEWPIHYEGGYPGNSFEVQLWDCNLEITLNRSHETNHMIAHGATGYYHIVFSFVYVLWVFVPMTYVLWLDSLNRALPWLNRRYADGYCQTCGYNLFSNVSGRCPECGEVCETDVGESMPEIDNDHNGNDPFRAKDRTWQLGYHQRRHLEHRAIVIFQKCADCGYCIHGLHRNNCPECGTMIERRAGRKMNSRGFQ